MHKTPLLYSAPVISLFVAGLALTGLHFENSIRTHDAKRIAFSISSDDGQEFDTRIDTSLPEPLTIEVDALVRATDRDTLEPQAVLALASVSTMLPDEKILVQSYVGRVLVAQNRFSEAMGFLGPITEAQRAQLGSSFAYAEALKGLGDTERAMEAYMLHISASPNHQAGHINYAIMLAQQDRHAAAIEILKHTIAITSGARKGKALALLGISYSQIGEHTKAENAFRRSIQYRPTHGPTWRRLAETRAQFATLSQATVLETFQRADAVAPGNFATKRAIASYFFSKGRFDDAMPYYRETTRLSPDNQTVLFERALNLLASGRPTATRNVLKKIKRLRITDRNKARVDLLTAVLDGSSSKVSRRLKAWPAQISTDADRYLHLIAELDRGNVESAVALAAAMSADSIYAEPAAFAIAKHHYRQNAHSDALAQFQDLLKSNQDSPFYWRYSGRVHSELGQSFRALEAHRNAHALYPTSALITIDYCKALSAVGKSDDALEVLYAFLEDKPRDVRVLSALAETYDEKGNYDRAEQVFQLVYDLEPEDLKIGGNLAAAQLKAGRVEDALRTADDLIEKEPSSIKFRFLRVDTLIALDRTEQVADELERILRLDPENLQARSALSRFSG